MMMVLVGLIFIVVGFNVYHSLRRSVFERMEEIAVLKAVGIPPRRIQAIFVLEGLFIGLAGAVLGLLAGLALAVNVSGVFSLVERVGQRRPARRAAPCSRCSPTGDDGEAFAIFSPTYFYLTQVPSHVFLAGGVPRLLSSPCLPARAPRGRPPAPSPDSDPRRCCAYE